VETDGERLRYFVIAYDSRALRVLSLTGHEHDFTGAVLTLTKWLQEYRLLPEVQVRLLAAASVPDLLARHAELFAGLALPEE
jgi:hypothetical protein